MVSTGESTTTAPRDNARGLNGIVNVRQAVRLGPGIPRGLGLPVAPPMVVDYRDPPPVWVSANRSGRLPERFSPSIPGEKPLSGGRGSINRSSSRSGSRIAVVGGARAQDRNGASALIGCFFDIECDDCNACTVDVCAQATCSGGAVPGSACRDDTDCTGGGTCVPLGSSQCIHTGVPDGVPSSGCDDGKACNGLEFCAGGVCVDGSDDLCAASPDLVCDESSGTCVGPCANDTDCDDGLVCNGTEVCDLTTGLCRSDGTNPCGPGAGCQEPATAGAGPTCGQGRCCETDGSCTAKTFADCSAGGGLWSVVGLPTSICSDLPCPIYSSGLSPEGTFTVSVGPISISTCDPTRVGDDYTIDAGLSPQPDFVDITSVRFVAGTIGGPARMSVEFWDANGVLVEDVFLPGSIVGSNAIRTLILEPPLTVPATGRIAFAVADSFNPGARITVMATDAVDVGGGNPSTLFINGADVNNFLTVCRGGSRDGQWCSPLGNPLLSPQACVDGGGTCQAVPDTLAFEITGVPGDSPAGACCSLETGGCTQAQPWVCAASVAAGGLGGTFQGSGTFCKACANNLFTICLSDADCPACVGGSKAGGPCTTASDCPGGACTGTATCNEFPDICALNACCGTSGTCDDTFGGFCSDNSAFCVIDADCNPGATCEPDCPPGTTPQGFGTFCPLPAEGDIAPNCCAQPTLSGGDNCLDVPVTSITVPPRSLPPATFTFTGSNASATFDDFNTRVCEGGLDPGTVCTTDAGCNGGTCTGRVCDFDFFNPNGGTLDPGWFEGFEIDACADVRIDLCCTDPVAQPAWAFLIRGCPCAEFVGSAGVEPPIGLGQNMPGLARGDPFCETDDNLWVTFGPLPPGRYFYPIFSAPGGSLRVPPGGTYQFHISATACREAACCHLACNAGPDLGLPCTSDAECSGEGVCASACAVVNELECDRLGGFWLADENLPATMLPIVSCTSSPCDLGSCCAGPGLCEDRALPPAACDPLTPSSCMSKSLCDAQGGKYVGAARCDFPTEPCPVCTVADASSCQFPTGLNAYDVDKFGLLGNLRVADDFIAVGNEIRQFCWWPVLFNPNTVRNCDAVFQDQWEIRFYEDAGGIPGALVPGSPGPIVVTAKGPFTPIEFGFQYSVLFDPPIPVTAGQRYWVEIAGTGDPIQCALNVVGSLDGNGWSLYDIDGTTLTAADRNRFLEDIAFCVDTGGAGIEIPGPQTGACCNCDGTCSDGVRAEDCLGKLIDDGIPSGTTIGEWTVGKTCAEIPACVPSRSPPGDQCATPARAENGSTIVVTQCSDTDGRTSLPCEGGNVISTIEGDVWYEYTATCTGRLVFDLCGDTDFDAIVAVFSDGTSTCPTQCPPPLSTLVTGACNDLGCNTVRGGGRIETIATPGQCFKIRIASDSPGQSGTGRLETICVPSDCIESVPPEPELILRGGGGNVMVPNTKNRYLSFSAGTPGRSEAIRVTFVDLPPPFSIWNGIKLWVNQPQRVSEQGGTGFGQDPGNAETYNAASLGCQPFFTDWTQWGVIHVFHPGIVPSKLATGGGAVDIEARYAVQVVDNSCEVAFEGSFSSPLEIVTSPWADIGGAFDLTANLFTAPDLKVDVAIDVVALIDSFANRPSAPRKARADLEPSILDGKINILEVARALDAFRGANYPFAPGPTPCP